MIGCNANFVWKSTLKSAEGLQLGREPAVPRKISMRLACGWEEACQFH